MDAFLEQGAGSQGQIFTANPVTLEHGLRSGQRRLNTLAAGSGSVLAAFQGGEVARWFPDEDEFTLIESKDRVGEVSRVLLDPTGFHALMTNSGGETWYLNFDCTAATRLPKLKGHVLESASWDVEATFGSTKDLLLGTRTGQILHVVIEFANGVGKEKTVKTAFEFERVPVVGVHRERVFSGDGLERLVLFACAGAFLHAFVGTSLESLLQRYAGEKVGHRTRVFEVPYDSPYGDLQVDDACVGEPGTKVLFWLTGVGVVAAKVQATVGEDSAGCVESPPGLVRFPGGKAQGNSVSPPPLPKVPRSMALTRFHLIFAFEDRWVAVSRITHEVVQQQDWASSTYGPLRSLANDVHGHRLWICSERHAFELVAEKEDRNVWALLLRLEQFDDALAACQRPSERMRVLAAHADWLFRKGPDMELEAARKFAQATAVPFEHVALRFLHRKAALLEYLRCRLRRAEDQVTRALLSVWAVEISLAQLNEHPDRSSDTHAELQKELVELLRQCSDLDVHATIYHLLQSHGWLDELAMFAEMRKDYTTVILHHVSRRDCAAAIRKLENMKSADGQELVCRFAPVLFGAEPKAFASLLLRPQLETLDPLLVLPGIFALHSRTHRSEATRYLEHAVRHERTEKSSGRTLRSGRSLLLDNNLGCVEEGQRYGWAVGGQAILNALVLLYAEPEPMEGEGSEAREGEGSEAGILRFLAAQEGNPLLDLHFALRVCRRQGLIKAVVMLYGLMAMHEEAVEVALEHQDVALAKHSACRPQERRGSDRSCGSASWSTRPPAPTCRRLSV
ncbi:unnamed protein product [Effrenium voratum]|nr:unnamed protein product [Effrenium voratum]